MELLNSINDVQDLKRIPREKLPELAGEIRQYILNVVSTNGGHLGAALGAVDLAIALHYCFNSPQDSVVWDVGHQAHAHKILTGRRDRFSTFRQEGGLAPFLNKNESEHDFFTTGHGGASISTSLGLAAGRRLKGQFGKAVAVIGDASLVSGMAFEALNHAGHLKDDLLVILNDNEMSISPTVGAFSTYLNKIISNPVYNHLREDVETFIRKIPRLGERMVKKARKIDEGLKNLFIPGLLFEELGFRYFGPLDGHNIEAMLQILENLQRMKGPLLLHLVTQKGKGYPIAEVDPARWHASAPFHLESGELVSKPSETSYTNAFGCTMTRLASEQTGLVAITAAMAEGTGLVEYSQKFPDRFFDVGIAEEHAVSFAAGLARSGLRPFVAIYSTFLQRSYDQIIHDVALQDLPVVFCLDRAGLVGEDGPTHHGVFDIAYLRKIPKMTLMAPRDGNEFEKMLEFAASYEAGPIAIRYPRGTLPEVSLEWWTRNPAPISYGRAEVLKQGRDVLLLGIGSMVETAAKAAALLSEDGIDAAVVNARFVKPLDEETILSMIGGKSCIVTLEEGALQGGFGSAVLEMLQSKGLQVPVLRFGVPDRFVEHGPRPLLLDRLNLTAERIRQRIVEKQVRKNDSPERNEERRLGDRRASVARAANGENG